MRNNFPKRPSGTPLHILSKLYNVPIDVVNHLSFEAVYFCGRRRMAVTQYRIICLFLEIELKSIFQSDCYVYRASLRPSDRRKMFIMGGVPQGLTFNRFGSTEENVFPSKMANEYFISTELSSLNLLNFQCKLLRQL